MENTKFSEIKGWIPKIERFDIKMKMLPHAYCAGEIVKEEEDVENIENHSR